VKRVFELGVLVKIVQNSLRLSVVLELDDDPDVSRGLIADVADALELFVADQVGHVHDEIGLVDAVRNRSDEDDAVPFLVFRNLRDAAHDHRPAASCRGMRDVFRVVGDTTRREVGALHEFKEVFG